MPSIRLEAAPASTAIARRFVRHALAGAAVDADLAALLVSELVSNVIVHSGSDFDVVVSTSPDSARVEVHDGSALTTAFRDLVADPPVEVDASAPSGRGLMLVSMMSAAFGLIDHGAAGKTVWFELAVTAPPEGAG